MKKLVLVIFSVIVLFNVSCIPEKNCCTLPQPSAHIMADRNGATWSSFFVNGAFSSIDSMKIGVITTADNMYPASKIDSMNIKILYTNKGEYTLHSNQVFYATFTNGATKSYKLDTTYNNILNITGFELLHNGATTNPDPTKITGTFNLKFIDPENAAGITFSNGNFYMLVQR